MVVVPVVDGQDLADLIKVVEKPFARAEGHSGLAGQYDGIRLDTAPKLLDYFMGRAGDRFLDEGKVALLGCSCGEEGCWPLLARVTVESEIVTWSHFEQPHRGPDAKASHWNYDLAPKFVFARAAYESAAQLADQWPGV